METLHLEVKLLDYWHAGSGGGSGPTVDAVPVKTAAGLPYLPGKSLRGLLREAVQLAEESGLPDVPARSTRKIFGQASRDQAESSCDSQKGLIHVSNAELPADYERWVGSRDNGDQLAATLFTTLASTAIEQSTGTAKPETLRVIEVALPLTLEARIDGPAGGPPWQSWIEKSLPFLRALGSGRRRGLGRVRVTTCGSNEEPDDE